MSEKVPTPKDLFHPNDAGIESEMNEDAEVTNDDIWRDPNPNFIRKQNGEIVTMEEYALDPD